MENSERSDGSDEIGPDPNMTGRGAAVVPWQGQSLTPEFFTVLYVFRGIYHFFVLLPQDFGREVYIAVAISNCVRVHILCGIRPRRNLTASYQRPDEIGSDPNMTGTGAAVVPWQDQSLTPEFFTVLYVFCEIYHFFDLLPQDFGRELNIAVAISNCVCVHILCGIRPRRNLAASHIHHIKPFFPLNTKPYFPSHIHPRFHIYDINPSSPSYEASYDECEIVPKKKKDGEDEITSIMIDDDLFSKNWLPGNEHSQHPEENTISPAYETKSSDGQTESWNQMLERLVSSNVELSQEELEFVSYHFDAEGLCSSPTHKDCGILGENVRSPNDWRFVIPLATELPCSDPALEQVMAAAFPAPVPHVTVMASSSLLDPTQDTLLVEERRAQSLQCLTESTAQDNLAQGHFLEEGRSVEMDEKLESTLQCIQIPQPATSSLHLKSFSNGAEENMQIDSSDSQSFDAISHPEKKNNIETGEGKRRKLEDEISLADLQQHFDKKRSDAAKSLSVSLSTLKRVSRKCGISRWPYSNKKNKLVTKSVQGALGAFNPNTSSHTDAAGSNYQHSQGSKAPKPQEEKLLTSCKKPSIGGLVEIADQMLESSPSAHEGRLQEQNRFHLQKKDPGSLTIKATYGEHTVKVPSSATSGIFELKQELARRLELEHGSINVKYEDEDGDLILVACDSALHECLTSSRGNEVIKLLVLDKVANSNNSSKAAGH